MATVRWLGLHQAPTLPFLIAESLLPPEHSEDDYVWQTQNVEGPTEGSHDEDVVYTKTCVVWSRGGVVKRVFKVDIEKEEIRHVVLTAFPSGRIKTSTSDLSSKSPGVSSQLAAREVSIAGRQTKSKGKEQQDEIPRLILKADGDGLAGDLNGASSDSSRALVVVLKTQAHIFFLAGNSHVVPLPFEVDSVFSSPRGLVFQRKIHDEGPSTLPMAPPNSFVSSQPQADFRSSQSFRVSRGHGSRLSSTVSPAQPSLWVPKPENQADLPRAFSLTDPHSEMGLVVANQSSRAAYGTQEPRGYDTLDPADEIVYVSNTNELTGVDRTLADFPLIFVVTLNANTGLYTLWTARYREEETGQDSKRRKKPLASGARSKRRSSHFGMATGATTPAGRPSGVRESLGTARNISGASFSQGYQAEENTGEADLASQIGHDFGDIGVPLKASRRVSSLLARTDLGTGQDRTTFSDLATGNPSNSAAYGSLRQSIGGYSNRASFGFNPRSSFAGNASVYSTNSSFLDAPVDRLLDELNNGGDFEGFESMDLTGSMSGLPKEMMLRKVESFSAGLSTGSISFAELKKSFRKSKIFTLRPNDGENLRKGDSTAIALCLLERNSKSLVVMNLKIESVTLSAQDPAYPRKQKKGLKTSQSLVVHATDIRHGANIIDACKIVDGAISRILALSSTMDGRGELTLQSPWSSPVKFELPSNLLLRDPHRMSIPRTSNRPQDSGLERITGDSSLSLIGVDHPSSRGQLDIIDSQKRRHRIQIQLQPRNPLVKEILEVCRFVLKDSPRAAEGMFVCWWEVSRWLRSREVNENDLEWTAIVVVLFTMAVGFIESEPPATPVKQTRRKNNLLRSSSGSYVDLESWNSMLEQMGGSCGISSPWMMSSSWSWVSEQNDDDFVGSPRHGKSPKIEQRPPRTSFAAQRDYPKNLYLTRCASLAREFFESPQGEAAAGAEGYLPTAVCQNQNTRRTALATILIALHLLREEHKLSVCSSESSYREMGMLAPVLAQIGGWLGWPLWTWKEGGYYGTEMASMDRWLFEDTRISGLEVPPEPFSPPSIFSFLKDSWGPPPASFFTLLDIVSAADRVPGKGKLWYEAFRLTPRTLALNGFMSEVNQKSTTVEKTKLLLRWGLTSNIIETFPEGVSAPLYEIIVRSQINPPTSWTSELVELIDRDDLYLSMNTENSMPPGSRSQPASSHDAIRDFHHIGVSTLDIDLTNSFEASIEADRIAITKLIFREDRRFMEASKLLNQSKAPVAQCIPEPEWSDSDLLEAQKEIVQLVTLRTLSVPAGRGMFMFSGRSPLLTEKLPIPSFSLQCVMKPSNVTISADRSLFNEEKVCWAFFHNGAATGLAISKASKGIDTSWILFNKPQELTNRHAGFLLALGLNGHLKNLAKWVAFKYLTPKHTMTSIGLLLGLSASYLGTMDTLITRLLSVHVTRMLPQGAAELNLSPLTQTAGVMGIGLLYCNSQHRRMSEVLLSEIENIEQEESTIAQEDLRDEGYRLAAGFALGFINLGKGKDLRGLRDMQVVERLLALAVGTKNVDLVHILDRATAGATVALAIIFMKTNDEALADKIDIPDSTVQFDYVRPDIFLLRTLARHLIMWDSIRPTYEWLVESIPPAYRRRYRLTGVRRLSSDDMAFFNIVAGLCFAVGLRYAGSADAQARDLLISYLDQFIRICRLPALHYDGKLARNSVRHCQDIVALSAAAVMAGTGDLALFRRLRSLHGRVDPDTPYGSHMAAHMALGMLFLGGGSYTLGTSNLAIASLLCAFYPVFPTTVLDNKCHLQAFRHLWVLAAEPRCLVPRDVDTRRPILIPVSLVMKNGVTKEATAPCLLPDLNELLMVKAHGRDHWPLVLDFGRNDQLREKFRRGDQSIYLRRNTTYDPSGTSVFASTLLGLSEAQDILPSFLMGSAKGPTAQLPNAIALLLSQGRRSHVPTHGVWDWIFSLPSLRGLDVSDRSIVLPPSPFQFRPRYPSDGGSVSLPPWLRLSAVDTRLVLESTVSGAIDAASGASNGSDEVRDRLWQLRLLFAWVDRGFDGDTVDGKTEENNNTVQTAEKYNGLWLRRDVIEEARWKIWGVQVGG
jgi:anaphase-promoting complex subunit 1